MLALGTNLGDKAVILAQARELISQRIGPILKTSTEHLTKAWGLEDQPDFLNQVIVVEFKLAAPPLQPQLQELLDRIQGIEVELGLDRSTKKHWGPRPCDIDIVFLGDLRYEDERLSIPHPWWAERDFVCGIIRRELAEFISPEFR